MKGIMGKFRGRDRMRSPEIPSDCSEDPRLSRDMREEGGWREELGVPGGWQGV